MRCLEKDLEVTVDSGADTGHLVEPLTAPHVEHIPWQTYQSYRHRDKTLMTLVGKR